LVVNEELSGAKVVAQKVRRKRNRTTIFMRLPELIFIFIVGWCMYLVGNEKRKAKIHARKPDNVTFLPIVYEEKYQRING